MKMKLIHTLALALIFAAAITGCGGHKPVGVTPIPGANPLPPPEPPPGPTLGSDNGSPQPNPPDFYTDKNGNRLVMDRTAFAANTIHFAYDSSAIKKAEQSNLQAVAAALKSDSNTKLLIEGNCDERGTEEYNRALGERRAGAARNALIKLGIQGDRIMTKSFGKDNPSNPGHDDAARAQNRRDEFVLLHPASGATPMGGS
jgi:peptidoglycan-associated lipoprotein